MQQEIQIDGHGKLRGSFIPPKKSVKITGPLGNIIFKLIQGIRERVCTIVDEVYFLDTLCHVIGVFQNTIRRSFIQFIQISQNLNPILFSYVGSAPERSSIWK